MLRLLKKGTSGLVPKPKLDQVVGFTPASSKSYILGNENHLIEKRPEDIKRSTYCPNITCNVFKHLLTHPNAKNLYLLGVKYSDSQDGDSQDGDSQDGNFKVIFKQVFQKLVIMMNLQLTMLFEELKKNFIFVLKTRV